MDTKTKDLYFKWYTYGFVKGNNGDSVVGEWLNSTSDNLAVKGAQHTAYFIVVIYMKAQSDSSAFS